MYTQVLLDLREEGGELEDKYTVYNTQTIQYTV